MGHSEEIANRHYRQVTEAHFAKAITTEIVMPKMMPLGAALSTHDAADEKGHLSQVVTVQEKTAACDSMQPFSLDDTRLEPFAKVPEITASRQNVGRSDAVDDAIPDDLAELIALWPGLPSEVKAAILRLAQQARSAAEWPQ